MTRVNGYRCDTCTKVQESNFISVDGVPFGWYAVKRWALIHSPTWTFCSSRCLYQWSSNRLREESGEEAKEMSE